MDDFVKFGAAILGGTFTLAIISVLVSRQSQTPQVIGSAGSALAGVVGAATAPVTGSYGGTAGGASFGSSFGSGLHQLASINSSLNNLGSLFA